jgi:hypothetical protein
LKVVIGCESGQGAEVHGGLSGSIRVEHSLTKLFERGEPIDGIASLSSFGKQSRTFRTRTRGGAVEIRSAQDSIHYGSRAR